MRKSLVAVLVLGGALMAWHVSAVAQASGQQTAASQSSANAQDDADKDIDMLRKDIRVQKRHMIETNVPMTDVEAQKFWPVFDQYTADLVHINNDKYALIKSYTQSYETMTDAQADDWAGRVLKLDADVAALRQSYWPKFRNVLPAKKAALYEQVERRTQMVIDVQLAAQFPLIQPKVGPGTN
jgi:hypothetical protein